MKDISIDGKIQRVYVLKQTGDRLVYIPLKDLHRVDYERLNELSEKEGELLKVLSRTTLDNGMNALTQYEHLLQIVDIVDGKGTRVRKPTEINPNKAAQIQQDPNAMLLAILEKLTNAATKPAPVVAPVVAPTAPAARKPAARKPAAKK